LNYWHVRNDIRRMISFDCNAVVVLLPSQMPATPSEEQLPECWPTQPTRKALSQHLPHLSVVTVKHHPSLTAEATQQGRQSTQPVVETPRERCQKLLLAVEASISVSIVPQSAMPGVISHRLRFPFPVLT